MVSPVPQRDLNRLQPDGERPATREGDLVIGAALIRPGSALFTAGGVAGPYVARLVAELQIPVDPWLLSDRKEVLRSLANAWMTSSGGMKRSLAIEHSLPLTAADRELFDGAGLSGARSAAQLYYSEALVMGGPAPIFHQRLRHLVAEWNRGVRFEGIAMLSSDRPLARLDYAFDELGFGSPSPRFSALLERVRTESEMMAQIWDSFAVPEVWRAPGFARHVAVAHRDGKGHVDTADTLFAYLAEPGFVPRPSYLVVSSQPFIRYQTYVTAAAFHERTGLPPLVEGVGDTAPQLPRRLFIDQVYRNVLWEQRLFVPGVPETAEMDTFG